MQIQIKPSFTARLAYIAHFIARPALWGALSLIILVAIGSGILSWRLTKGPLDAAPAIQYLEKIVSANSRLRFNIGALQIARPTRTDPLILKADNLRLSGPNGQFIRVEHIDMGIATWRLLLGQLHFSYANAANLSIRLTRLKDGTLTLSGLDDKTTTPENPIPLAINNIVADLPAIDKLSLNDMQIVFDDKKGANFQRFKHVDMQINQQNEASGRALAGYLTTPLTGIDDAARATFDFIYEPADQTLTATAALDEVDMRRLFGRTLMRAGLPLIDMRVGARAEIRLKNNFMPEHFALRMKGDDGTLIWPRHYGHDLQDQTLRAFEVDMSFNPQKQQLKLDQATINIKGITLNLDGTLSAQDNWAKLQGSLHANIPVIAVDVLPAIWPSIWTSGARTWLVDRMQGGRLRKIDVSIPFSATRTAQDTDTANDDTPAYSWAVPAKTIEASFAYAGIKVDYRTPMQEVQNLTGTGKYHNLSLTLDISKGNIGALKLQKADMFFDDLITPGTGEATLNANLNGSVGDVFAYLEREPISYRKKVSIDASQAKGNAAADVKVTIPLTANAKVEDIHVQAKLKLTDFAMPDVIKGLALAGPSFDLEATENRFSISGTGTLGGRPATLSWAEVFSPTKADAYASRLEAEISTDKALRQKFIGRVEDRITGTVPAKINMRTLPNGKGSVKVNATLDSATINLQDLLGTSKQAGQKTALKLEAILQDGNLTDIKEISAHGAGLTLAHADIAFTRDKDGDPTPSKLSLKGLKIAKTDADIAATWAPDGAIKAKVSGKAFDARGILGDKSNKSSGASSAYDVSITTDNLYMADTPLEGATGTFVGNPDGTIRLANLDAKTGTNALTLRYGATGGAGDRLLLDATDAGAALAALGISDRIRGGTLRVEGTPIPKGKAGDMQGTMQIADFSVIKAPVLAKLINLLSVPGLLNILKADTGLHFARAEAEFSWLNRKDGATIHLQDGRTSGASLGLTFEGDIDTGTSTLALNGTAIPLSEVNGLISNIPLIGNILSGGKNSAVFAATYKVKGSTSDPDVSVNPLSVLTPGILRRILFE